MKKIIAVFLTLLILFGAVSCAGEPDITGSSGDPEQTEGDGGKIEGQPTEPGNEGDNSGVEDDNSKPEDVGSDNQEGKHMLDGKKIIFIGDSFVYYGNAVILKSSDVVAQAARNYDKGYFYQICKSNGAEVSVTNWTYSGKAMVTLYNNGYMDNLTDRYYDYVVLSGGRSSSSTAQASFDALRGYIDMFTAANPNVKFLYLVSSGAHNISVEESFPVEILNNLKEFEKMGVTIVDWGKLVSDIIRENVSVPNAEKNYFKNSFVIQKSDKDGYHPNQLSGYITALMTYCAITGESAVGQSYDFWDNKSISAFFNPDSFISKYYTKGDTNYPDIFSSPADMQGLQTLIDKYLEEKAYREYQFVAK